MRFHDLAPLPVALAVALAAVSACKKDAPATETPEPAAPGPAAEHVHAEEAAPATAPAEDPLTDLAGPKPEAPKITLDQQIDKGIELYDAKCAKCHGKDGFGNKKVPALLGEKGLKHHKFETAYDVRTYIIGNMPPKAPNPMPEDEADALTAFVLKNLGVSLPGPLWSENVRDVKITPAG